MTDKVVVLTTAGKLKDARNIAKALVEAKLAACVNLLPPVESTYYWQGNLENSRERLLLIKTSRTVYPRVESEIRKLHGYTTPEIICLPIIDGSRDYLEWLDQSIEQEADNQSTATPLSPGA